MGMGGACGKIVRTVRWGCASEDGVQRVARLRERAGRRKKVYFVEQLAWTGRQIFLEGR